MTRNYGDIITSSTGSEDETRPTFDAEDNFVANVPQANPHITDRTWARAMDSYTGSAGRPVPSIVNETWAGTLSSKTVVGSMSDLTIAGTMTNVNLADMTNINVGTNKNITIGPIENINVGAMLDVTLSAMLQVCLSAGVSINLGPKADYTFPETLNLSEVMSEITGAKTSVAEATSFVSGIYTVTAAMIMLG